MFKQVTKRDLMTQIEWKWVLSKDWNFPDVPLNFRYFRTQIPPYPNLRSILKGHRSQYKYAFPDLEKCYMSLFPVSELCFIDSNSFNFNDSRDERSSFSASSPSSGWSMALGPPGPSVGLPLGLQLLGNNLKKAPHRLQENALILECLICGWDFIVGGFIVGIIWEIHI